MNAATKFDLKIGSAVIAMTFLLASFFSFRDNDTLFWRLLSGAGIDNVVGSALLVVGLMMFIGSVRPVRCLRHLGQALAFVLACVLAFSFIAIGAFPAIVCVLVVNGCGALWIFARDAWHGKNVREKQSQHDVTGAFHDLARGSR